MNKASWMIEENNKLREKLSLENQDYYENLLVYMRTVGLFYDDKELEQLLLQILQDIIAAQNEGETAENYFGKNPQETADELLKNIGTSKKEFLKIFGIIFGVSSFFSFFSQLSDNRINFLILILNGFVSFLGVSITFKLLHKEIYEKKKPTKVRSFLKVWLFFVLLIGSFILVSIFTPPILTITLSNPIVIGFIAAILFTITGWAFFSSRPEKQIAWSFVPILWVMGAFGIASKVNAGREFLASSGGKTIVILLLLLGLLIYFGLFYFATKKGAEK